MNYAFAILDIGLEIIKIERAIAAYPPHSIYRAPLQKELKAARLAELMLIAQWDERRKAA